MLPDYHAAEAGAQVLAYVLGVQKAGSVDPGKVRKALGDLKFMSFYGGWKVDENGMQVGHTMVDVQWQDGIRVIVWPEEAQTGKVCYPMPTFQEKAKGAKARDQTRERLFPSAITNVRSPRCTSSSYW